MSSRRVDREAPKYVRCEKDAFQYEERNLRLSYKFAFEIRIYYFEVPIHGYSF